MYNDIMLAVDLVDQAAEVKTVRTAVALAQAFGARIHIITVVPDYGMSMVGSFFTKDHERQAIVETDRALHVFAAANIPKGIWRVL